MAFWVASQLVCCSAAVICTKVGGFFRGGIDSDAGTATLYATVSASLMIEQGGLPTLRVAPETGIEEWNNDLPQRRLDALRGRHVKEIHYKHH